MCIVTCRNTSIAVRVRKTLKEKGIDGEIVNIDPAITKRGCAYGVELSSVDCFAAEEILRKKHVGYGEIIR